MCEFCMSFIDLFSSNGNILCFDILNLVCYCNIYFENIWEVFLLKQFKICMHSGVFDFIVVFLPSLVKWKALLDRVIVGLGML